MSTDSLYKPICADLFSGAGGLSEGLRLAGFQTVLSLDFDENAVETFKRNHKGAVSLCKDIAELTGDEVLEACGNRELDLLAGGPSCQGYSTHGKRIETDPRNYLFEHFIRITKEVQPKWILIENVKGLLTFRRGYFRDVICKGFESIGYDIAAKVLCAADYGVPQMRHRIFFLGTRTGIPISFPQPTHGSSQTDGLQPYVTVREAIDDLPLIGGQWDREEWDYVHSPSCDYQRYARQYNPKLTLHVANSVSEQAEGVLKFIGEGQGLRAVPADHLPDRFKRMRRISNGNLRRDCTTLYYRLHRDQPAYTITCYYRNVASGPFTHPLENRSLSHREAARLMSFQDRYQFCGTGISRQIGNAVPPLLARAVGKHLLTLLAARETVREPVETMV